MGVRRDPSAMNHALPGCRRPHPLSICWGSWHGPHALTRRCQRWWIVLHRRRDVFSEAAICHEHEWKSGATSSCPEGKILIPGGSAIPATWSSTPAGCDRIVRYAELVGRERYRRYRLQRWWARPPSDWWGLNSTLWPKAPRTLTTWGRSARAASSTVAAR
jgi:hypothetical protein